jgi:hypothetical protein
MESSQQVGAIITESDPGDKLAPSGAFEAELKPAINPKFFAPESVC